MLPTDPTAKPAAPSAGPTALTVSMGTLESCFTRASQRPEVLGSAPVPDLPDVGMENPEFSAARNGRFHLWLVRQGQTIKGVNEAHPFWLALVAEGFDARWVVNPSQGTTLLQECCDLDLIDAVAGLVTAFVHHGQPLDVVSGPLQETALGTAVRIGALPCAQALLDAGASARWTSSRGSLLWMATSPDRNRTHQPALVKTLVEHGARDLVDVPGEDGMTPLHHAVRQDRIPTVQGLLNAGADPRLLDPDGRDVRTIAQRRENADICAMIDRRWVALERTALREVLGEAAPDGTLVARPVRRL